VANPQRNHGREAATGAVAGDGDPPGIPAECKRMCCSPSGRGHAIIRRRRKPMLWLQSVIAVDNHARRTGTKPAANSIVRIEVQQDEAAAMKLDEQRKRTRAFWGVEASVNVSMTARQHHTSAKPRALALNRRDQKKEGGSLGTALEVMLDDR